MCPCGNISVYTHGLEEILNQIKADANEEAADILAKAQDTCDSIKENAQIEIDKIETAGTKKAESEEKLLFSKIKSAAGMEAKQKYLEAKQKIISDIVNKAYNKMVNASDEEYFGYLIKMTEEYAQPAEGKMCLNKKDLERLPKDFQEKISEAANKNNGKLSVSNEPINIENGMILDYGDIVENCTFDAVFHNKKDDLQDEINRFLFK